MKTFIKKYEFNYIKKCMNNLNNSFRNCTDPNMIKASKSYIEEKIFSSFQNLSNEEKEILAISDISEALQIEAYLKKLEEFTHATPKITKDELKKLFKKEKKLNIPNNILEDSNQVYFGWIDDSSNKLFVAYHLDGKLVGMACRLPNQSKRSTHICSVCNHVGSGDEVAFVSPLCKTDTSGKNSYRSIGFDLCLDSKMCNERITSTEKLEKILKNVNNIK